MRGRVLIVDDEREMVDLLVETLGRRGFQVQAQAGGKAALAWLATNEVDAVVTDLHMADVDGLQLARALGDAQPDVPVIVLTGFGSLETAVGGIRAGVWDFLTKPVEIDALALAIDRAVQQRTLRVEVRRLREIVGRAGDDLGLLGVSPPMDALRALIQRVAAVDVSALVTGESGAGKEGVARAIHQASARAKGPFVPVNCAALPGEILESELFGHVRGAFTDARQARTGLFFEAHGGTLFLDEIAELPLSLQPKLLRALQERRARPVGGDRELPFDVRFVFATNRDLEAEVQAGRFREDLFYRINVVHLAVPPLRVRGGDILLLAQRFVERCAAQMGRRVRGISPAAAEHLLRYDWPGNVRELQNVVERAVALTTFDSLTADDLPERVRAYRAPRSTVSLDGPEPPALEVVERAHIEAVLAYTRGHRGNAARLLGLDRKTLYRKLERWGLAEGGEGP